MATRKVTARSSKTSRSRITSPTSASSYRTVPRATTDAHTPAHLNQSQTWFSRLSFNLQSRVNAELDYGSGSSSGSGDLHVLDGIIGSSLKIHQVSPLFNLQIDASRLKQYSKHMKESLSCQCIDPRKSAVYDAKFTWFRSYSDNNFEALQVEVNTSSETKPEKTSYMGILLSSFTLACPSNQFVHLPLLLCKGSSKMIQAVHGILHNLFDCIITQMKIPPSDLMWLSAMLNSDQESHKQKHVMAKFKYHVSANNAIDAVSVCLPSKVLIELWQRVHSSTSSLVTHEEVKSFHDAVYQHLRQTQYLNLANYIFVRFSLPTLIMDTNGSVKMLTKYSAIQTLTFIQSLTNTFENSRLTWT